MILEAKFRKNPLIFKLEHRLKFFPSQTSDQARKHGKMKRSYAVVINSTPQCPYFIDNLGKKVTPGSNLTNDFSEKDTSKHFAKHRT